MATLSQVIEGLKKGIAYERTLEDDGGKEYVTPIGNGEFRHDVSGMNTYGGWGGSNTLPIEILNSGRWEQDGWEPSS